jgi:hypothetical protein
LGTVDYIEHKRKKNSEREMVQRQGRDDREDREDRE